MHHLCLRRYGILLPLVRRPGPSRRVILVSSASCQNRSLSIPNVLSLPRPSRTRRQLLADACTGEPNLTVVVCCELAALRDMFCTATLSRRFVRPENFGERAHTILQY